MVIKLIFVFTLFAITGALIFRAYINGQLSSSGKEILQDSAMILCVAAVLGIAAVASGYWFTVPVSIAMSLTTLFTVFGSLDPRVWFGRKPDQQ